MLRRVGRTKRLLVWAQLLGLFMACHCAMAGITRTLAPITTTPGEAQPQHLVAGGLSCPPVSDNSILSTLCNFEVWRAQLAEPQPIGAALGETGEYYYTVVNTRLADRVYIISVIIPGHWQPESSIPVNGGLSLT
jgi:hypothetical protein